MAKKKMVTIDENDFPSNSKMSGIAPIRELAEKQLEEIEEQEKRESRLPRGRVIQKKRTFVQSVAESLMGGGTDTVGGYILNEILVPAFKSTLKDMISSIVETALGGGESSSKRPERERSTINYGSFSKRRDDRRRMIKRDRFELDDIYFKDHEDAEEVLDQMCERLLDYDEVSVADYFDMAGIDGATWTHSKWGWTNLKRARLTHTRHGYAIILPEPEELE